MFPPHHYSIFIFAHIPLSVMTWSNCSSFRRLGMCSLQYSSLTSLGINPHIRVKLGLLFPPNESIGGRLGGKSHYRCPYKTLQQGKKNAFIKTLWGNFPKEVGKMHTVSDVRICASQLLPQNTTAYFNYTGSLTTPPCSEIVNWIVLKTPIEISKSQIDRFTSIFKNTARPIKSLCGRVVKESE